jgi:Ca-activated chloride channel homolog
MKYCIRSVLLTALCLSVALAQSGRRVNQEPATAGEVKDSSAITIRTEEVFLNVAVRDSLGRAVEGLKADDFFIYDNGRRYAPLHFESKRAPVKLLLLLDETRGVFDDSGTIIQSILSFRRALDPEDRVAAMRFSDEIELTQDWRNDEAALSRALKSRTLGTGKSAIYDALVVAAAKLSEVEGHRVIMLFTSGLNTAGGAGFGHAMAAIRRAGATLYAFSQTEAIASAIRNHKPETPAGNNTSLSVLSAAEARLTDLAETSGGMIFFPLRESSLSWMLEEVAGDLRAQYLITYQPQTESDWLSNSHRVEVLVRGGHKTYVRHGRFDLKPNPDFRASGAARIQFISSPARIY